VTLKSELGSLKVIKMVPFESLCNVSYLYFIVTSRILYRFEDIARCWSKIAIFSYPLHPTPPIGGFRRNIAIPFGEEITRMMGLCDGEKKFEDMCNCFNRIPACDRRRDGRTNRRTDR